MFCNCKNCCNEIYGVSQEDFNCLQDQWSNNVCCTIENLNAISPKPEPCCCCCCCSCSNIRKKTICKGRFGLAWMFQTSNKNYCEPCGWQIELEDTASKINQKCEQLVKWVNSPPCVETNREVSENNCCCMACLYKFLCQNEIDDCKNVNTAARCSTCGYCLDATVNTEYGKGIVKERACECYLLNDDQTNDANKNTDNKNTDYTNDNTNQNTDINDNTDKNGNTNKNTDINDNTDKNGKTNENYGNGNTNKNTDFNDNTDKNGKTNKNNGNDNMNHHGHSLERIRKAHEHRINAVHEKQIKEHLPEKP